LIPSSVVHFAALHRWRESSTRAGETQPADETAAT
jgi:hypothetical protein